MNRVFADFQTQLDQLLQDEEFATPELRETQNEFRLRDTSLREEVAAFQSDRASRLLVGVPKKLRERDEVKRWIGDSFYPHVLTTAAFQNAMFLTFFGVVDQINADRSKPPASSEPLNHQEIGQLFDGYLSDLNSFFVPVDTKGLSNLIGVFYGELNGDDGALVATNHNLRRILLATELKPDEWPKFRVILQELWNPQLHEARAVLEAHREIARCQALDRYIDREIKEFCREKGIREIGAEERAKIEQQCSERLRKGFDALGVKLNAAELLKRVRVSPPETPDE